MLHVPVFVLIEDTDEHIAWSGTYILIVYLLGICKYCFISYCLTGFALYAIYDATADA